MPLLLRYIEKVEIEYILFQCAKNTKIAVPINMISMITNDNYDNHVHIGNTINMITSLG